MRPQPFSLVGDGAGSIFKIFTTAAAMQMGMGINTQLEVPGRFQTKGMGNGGAKGCPKETWCVINAGNYRGSMSVTDALATSPNTAFARLIQLVGVPRTVDMAVKLGLRSYARSRQRAQLRPGEQREPGRLHQAAEHRLVHAGPVRAERAGAVQCRGNAGLRRHLVPAESDRQADRPQRQPGGRSPPRHVTRWCPKGWPTPWPTP